MSKLFDDDAAPAHAQEKHDGLNPEQRAAVRHGEGPLMVVPARDGEDTRDHGAYPASAGNAAGA